MMRRVYISSPYTAASDQLVQVNIERALSYVERVRQMGACPVVPHVAVPPFPGLDVQEAWGPAMQECLSHLQGCDAIFMAPRWEESRGCRVEFAQASTWEIPVFTELDSLKRWLGAAA